MAEPIRNRKWRIIQDYGWYCLALLPWFSSVPTYLRRQFDSDEFQHVHSAWGLAQGLVPYRDYFEHHSPLFYFVLAPILAGLHPETSFHSAARTMILLRWLSWLFTGGAAVSLFFLSYCWIKAQIKAWTKERAAMVGALSFLLLANMSYFWEKTLEIRPDVPAMMCLLLGVAITIQGLHSSVQAQRRHWFAGSGLFFSLALLLTQKSAFPILGVLGFWLIYLADRRVRSPAGSGISGFLWAIGGGLIPALLICFWFLAHHGFRDFWHFTTAFNLGWQSYFSPAGDLRFWATENLFCVVFAALGVFFILSDWVRKSRADPSGLLLVCGMAGGLAGVLFIPEPYHQTYLPFLLFVSTIAAFGTVKILQFAGRYQKPIYACLVTVMALHDARVPSRQPDDNQRDFDRLKWVMDNSSPEDTVWDTWDPEAPYAAFRRSAGYYWSHQPQMVAMIPNDRKQLMIDRFLRNILRPKIMSEDKFTWALSPALKAFTETHYSQGPGHYWLRRD